MRRLAPSGLGPAALALALATSGCFHMPHYRARPEFAQTARSARTVGLVSPVVKVYEFTAGGQTVLKDEWSTLGRKAVTESLQRALAEKGWKVKMVDPSAPALGPVRDELEEMRLLYGDVGPSIFRATYVFPIFTEKYKNFDYSVGPVRRILEQSGVDLLVLAYGSDEVSSGGRAVVNALNALLGTGSTGGDSFLNVALIDRNGKVLWFDVEAARGSFDLRDPSSADVFVRRILDRMDPSAS